MQYNKTIEGGFCMKKVTALILSMVLLLTVMISAATFSDMPGEDYWSYPALISAVESGLLNGSDGKIYPQNNLTRAEMATILVRAYALTETTDISDYTDVKLDAWYYSYMQKACAKGLFKGDSSKRLNPDANISRQEVFVVLFRALELAAGSELSLDVFSDKNEVASWALSETAAMVSNGYIKGSDGKINPQGMITREEFAQIMYNLKNLGALDKKQETSNDTDVTSGNETPSGSNTETPTGSSTGSSTGSGSSSGKKSDHESTKDDKDKDKDKDEDPQGSITGFEGVEEHVDMDD